MTNRAAGFTSPSDQAAILVITLEIQQLQAHIGREGMTMEKTEASKPKHLLLATAKSYPVSEQDLAPKNCEYSISQGAWVIQDGDSLLVENPERPRPVTKKFDIETGEDQKGA